MPFLRLLGTCLLLLTGPAYAYVEEITPSLVTFSSYRPTFFVIGTKDAKVQLSFKVQGPQDLPLYVAYTQLMLWDIFASSSPFRDINYNPELFYRLDFKEDRWLDLGLYEHESNGKAGLGSRSWNRSYLRYAHTSPLGPEGSLHWTFMAWVPYGKEGTTRDVARYRGVLGGSFSLLDFWRGAWEQSVLTLRWHTGGKSLVNPLEGGQELTFKGRFRKSSPRALWTLQLFHGYGENLLDYRERRTAFRVGLSF